MSIHTLHDLCYAYAVADPVREMLFALQDRIDALEAQKLQDRNAMDAMKLANEQWSVQCRQLEKQLAVQTYAADNYRRLLYEGDHAYAEMESKYQALLRVAINALMDMDNGLVVHEGHWRTRQHVAVSKIKECLK